MSKIETATIAGRFTEAEIRANVRESKAFWASSAGIKRAYELEREKRNRQLPATKFPHLVKKGIHHRRG